jgi:nucleoside-diphosphate-sugar epimerase
MNASAPPALPDRIADTDALEEFMTRPSAELIQELANVEGELMVLGVGGKMGTTLARMAKRAAPTKRVIGVARFTDAGVRDRLEACGVECRQCDLLDRGAVEQLPRARNIIFMAGQKFGTADNRAQTWAMNVGVPYLVGDIFRDARIVAFSTACVYPFVDVRGPGAGEETVAQPPPGDYAASCVGREQVFRYHSLRHGTPGRLVRLSYAIELRYGVLHDVASSVFRGLSLDLAMGYVNVIWQGDANEAALRLFAHCTVPTSPLNVSGPRLSVRWLADEFGRRFGKAPQLTGREAENAWLVDTAAAHQLLGAPRVPVDKMIDWVADWVAQGRPSLGKRTHFEARDGNY